MRIIILALSIIAFIGCSKGSNTDAATDNKLPEGSKVVGLWTDPTPVPPGQAMIYSTADGKLILRSILADDGGFYEADLRQTTVEGAVRYDYTEDMHGEYFIIEPSGDLGFYNAEGKQYAVGSKIEAGK